MRLGNVATLSAFLARLSRAPSGPHPDVVETLDQSTPSGAVYDLYAPRAASRSVVVSVHGVTVNGSRDERLVHFARSLARSRVTCAVPLLPGLAACRSDPGDLDALASVTREVASRAGARAGLIGFSFGASYCLVVAGRPDVAPHCRFVLAFGAYHSLGGLYAHHARADVAAPRTDQEWDDLVYLRLVLAAGNRDAVRLPEAAWHEVDSMLHRFCHQASLAEKRELFERHLRTLDLVPLAEKRNEATLAALSPAGMLQRVACPVSIVHDESDTTVPSSHAGMIFDELRGGAGREHRLLVTPLLSHVTLSNALRLGDVSRLYAALGPILETV